MTRIIFLPKWTHKSAITPQYIFAYMYNVGTIKCLTCRTVWFNEILNRTLTTFCIQYGGHVFWKRVIIHNLERYYHKTIPSSFRPYKLHSIYIHGTRGSTGPVSITWHMHGYNIILYLAQQFQRRTFVLNLNWQIRNHYSPLWPYWIGNGMK